MKRLSCLLPLASLLPALCGAESSLATRGSASARLSFRIEVPAIFRVLQVTPVDGALEYRVWTNMKTVHINNREYRFAVLGESTLRVPLAGGGAAQLVHGL